MQVQPEVSGFVVARHFLAQTAGQGIAEYGLILALVALVVIVALTAVGGGVSSTLNSIASTV